MASKHIQSINQNFIELGIRPIIAGSESETKRFCQAYYYQYVTTVIDLISLYMNEKTSISNIWDDIHADSESAVPFEVYFTRERKTYHFAKQPFYLRAYPQKEADALQEDVLHWDSSQINKFLSKTSNSKIRRKRKAAFKGFMNLDRMHREKLWQYLTGRNLPENGVND